MKILRLLLFPVVPLYWMVTGIRNVFYDTGIFASQSYDFPVICVGNLSTGGTGKTPMTEYLIRLLKDRYQLTTLSRGYGRTTNGYLLANEESNAKTLGDEPFQLYTKFNESINVAVCEDRRQGIKGIRSDIDSVDVVVLDDAYQHRAVKAGFNILLTSFDKLYVNDVCLPTGNLREPISGADRADVIVVTKCPKLLPEEVKNEVRRLLDTKMRQTIYFSYIDYGNNVVSKIKTLRLSELKQVNFSLVTGIANPKPLVDFLNDLELNFEHLSYKDHHDFSDEDITALEQYEVILTTEKDYVRLKDRVKRSTTLYYLPIEMKIMNEDQHFKSELLNFVKSYS